MLQNLKSIQQKRVYLSIAAAWILLWVVPWGRLPAIQKGNFLAFLMDMSRLGIALLIFLFPGVLLFLLLKREDESDFDLRGILPIGFAFSVTIIAVIGLLGRIAGFSFGIVRDIFATAGVVELILLVLFKPNIGVSKSHLLETFRADIRNPPLLLALLLATLMTFHDSLFFIDDTTYLAYLTNWQYSSHLGFQNIVQGGNVIEQARFWLALYPMGQALLSNLSGVPGILLLSNYLELFLVPIAVITAYWFALTLGLSRKAAGFAALIQVTLYTWMVGEQFPVGMWFYQNMAEDKVSATFLLAPVFIFFVFRFIKNPIKINLTLILISGLGLTFTHPVILFFTCVLVSGVSLIAFFEKMLGWRRVLQLFLLFGMLMVPYLGIRLSGDQSQAQIPFDAESAQASFQIERYTNVINDTFYGLNPEVLKFFDIPPETVVYIAFQFIRMIPIYLAILAGILAFVNIRKGPLYWYILSCVLLVFFVTLPYTGWLFGYFVSARLISRASWFSPLGLGTVLVLISLRNWFEKQHTLGKIKSFHRRMRLDGTVVGLVACFVFVSPILGSRILPRVPFYFERLNHNKQLAQIGAYIDQHTTKQTTAIALDYWDTQLLPGVSAHTELVSFREEKEYNGFNYFLSVDEIHKRIYASNIIRSLEQDVSAEEQCTLLREFNMRFIVAPSQVVETYSNKFGKCNIVLKDAFRTRDLTLLEIK